MRYILKVIRAVEKLYAALDEEAEEFKQLSGLKCPSGCSACCTKPAIEASVLEMMPLAWYLYKNNLQDHALERIETRDSICGSYVLMDTGRLAGRCNFYEKRPLICRLFGNSAVSLKCGKLEIYTCQTIKLQQPLKFQFTQDNINKDLPVPIAYKYRLQLDAIDIALASDINPINESLRKAMEKISFYFRINPQDTYIGKTGT